jgi:hypothetical protein
MAVKISARKKLYIERKANGCCPRCGKKLKARIKTIYCDDCKTYFVKYNEKNAESINEARRGRYVQRKEARKCPRCGKSLSKGYKKILCARCLGK